jgi:hypothetical protein
MASVIYTVIGLGVKFSDRCVKCRQPTGTRSFELADTILLRDPASKFDVAHPSCIGITTKGKVGGGRALRGLLPETVKVTTRRTPK